MRRSLTGSALIRLLDRLSGPNVRESGASTSDRLSQWFSWTDAISLSAALDGVPATGVSGARTSSNAEEGECLRVRTALAKAIAEDSAFATPQEPAQPEGAEADFAPYRQRYVARQQAIEAGVGALRGRLRSRLANRSPAMAKLAAVDVVMEQVLSARERSLLATVPGLLEKHFKRLHKGAEAAGSDEWLGHFRKDAREVLLAELDFRFQPVEGLLDALRTK